MTDSDNGKLDEIIELLKRQNRGLAANALPCHGIFTLADFVRLRILVPKLGHYLHLNLVDF
jgi:hypothetical protein